MNDEKIRRAEQARAILESPLWTEAWDAYRTKLFALIETADSNEPDIIMQAKRLLTAGKAARSWLELLIKDGAIAANDLRLANERKGWFQRRDIA